GAQVILQPLNSTGNIGVNNLGGTDPTFASAVNYPRLFLQSFTQNATFYVGATPASLKNDSTVPAGVRGDGYAYSGDIHIGSNGGLALGFRSISAQTSGKIIAWNV